MHLRSYPQVSDALIDNHKTNNINQDKFQNSQERTVKKEHLLILDYYLAAAGHWKRLPAKKTSEWVRYQIPKVWYQQAAPNFEHPLQAQDTQWPHPNKTLKPAIKYQENETNYHCVSMRPGSEHQGCAAKATSAATSRSRVHSKGTHRRPDPNPSGYTSKKTSSQERNQNSAAPPIKTSTSSSNNRRQSSSTS